MSRSFLKNFNDRAKSSIFLVFPMSFYHAGAFFRTLAKKIHIYYSLPMKCTLCPRKCGADRSSRPGFCKVGADAVVNLYKLHFGEEPVISGTKGSGTVFFSGCNLGCIFCQNRSISASGKGEVISSEKLADIYKELEYKGAHNINLVTPMHFAPSVVRSLEIAKAAGLKLPVAINTGSYDSVETLKMFDGLVDIYMPDFKFWSDKISAELTGVFDYREVASAAIDEMFRQTGRIVIGEDGMLKKGLIVRHLAMPTKLFDSKHILEYLCGRYGNDIFISLMSQYTPMPHLKDLKNVPPYLFKTLNPEHYDRLNDLLCDLGQENAFVQDDSSIGDEMIPDFKI